MRKLMTNTLCVLILISTGCANNGKKSEPAVGDTVIARWSGPTSMYEGKVEKIDAEITVKWSDGSKASEVDKKFVFAKPVKGDKIKLENGEWVFARWGSGTKWYGSKVLGLGDMIEVKYVSDASTGKVAHHDILKAPEGTHQALKKALISSQLLRDAKAAGEPFKPQNWKPNPGDEVIAIWSASTWYQGTVQSVKENKATVKWKDNSQPSEVTRIVPVPKDQAAKAVVDDFVLIAPKEATGFAIWQYAKVTGVDGDKIHVLVQDGNKRTMNANQYLVIK